MYKISTERYLLNVFDNIDDLYHFTKNTPRRPGADNSSETESYSFTGTESIGKAYNLLRNGDEELYKEINEQKSHINIQKILGNVINRNKLKNDIVGFIPDVPAFLKGIPCNMINTEPKKLSQKIINIAVDVAVSWHIDKNDMKKAGILYLTIIDILEKAGYRCNLYALKSSEHMGKQYMCAVRIKTDREPLNIKKMAFCLAHASFLRRILFKWVECCDFSKLHIEPTRSGYGHPYDDISDIKNILKKHIKSDFLVWKLQQDCQLNIEDIIKRLENDGIKLENN